MRLGRKALEVEEEVEGREGLILAAKRKLTSPSSFLLKCV